MITTQQAKVYYAPTARRRYFTLAGAVAREATAIILKKYPVEPFEQDTGHYFDIRMEDNFERMHKKLSFIIKKKFMSSKGR